jgi:hypothetical protein
VTDTDGKVTRGRSGSDLPQERRKDFLAVLSFTPAPTVGGSASPAAKWRWTHCDV